MGVRKWSGEGWVFLVLLRHVTVIEGESTVLHRKGGPALYPRFRAKCCLLARYSCQKASPKRCQLVVGGGIDWLQIDTFVLKSSDTLDETFPVDVKPFQISFEWKQVVRVWVWVWVGHWISCFVYDLDYHQSWCRFLYAVSMSPSSENADSDSHIASVIGYSFHFKRYWYLHPHLLCLRIDSTS